METKIKERDFVKTFYPEIRITLLILGLFLSLVYLLPMVIKASTQSVENYLSHRRDEKAAVHWQRDSVKIEKHHVSFQKRIEKVKLLVSKEQQLALFYNLLNESAEKSNLRFNALKPLPERETDAMLTASFEVSLNGGYHEIGRFLNLLEKSGFIVHVAGMTLKGDRAGLGADMTLEFMAMK